jgi:FSR family fosmidomycin resistance protein-like MFS transporter
LCAVLSAVIGVILASAFSAILVYAQEHGLPFVFHICSYLPLIGLLTALLPNLSNPRRRRVKL